MKKTLGGDRLGSGKKMQVELHGYERSTHDLGYIWRSTMSAGTLVPFMNEIALPGDTFDINLDCDIKTHPTLGPLFGSYKVQLDVFQCPIRLYNSLLHNNMLGIGMEMSKVKLPQIRMTAYASGNTNDLDNSQINPSSILSYLGLRGIGKTDTTTTRDFNAISLLAYWEIYKNYYSNKQEKKGAVIHTGAEATAETVDDVEATGNGLTWTVNQRPSVSASFVLEPTSTIKVNFTGTAPNPLSIYIYFAANGAKTLQDACTSLTFESGYIIGNYNYAQWGTDYIENWDYQNADTPIDTEPKGDIVTGKQIGRASCRERV